MQKRILKKLSKIINNWKVKDHCDYTGKYRGVANSISYLKFNMTNEIPVIFCNGSNYDYHFIIRELAKRYFDMNTKLKQKTKNNFEKDFFKLMNNAVSGKTMQNVRKHRNIKLVTTERRRNYLVSEPNYHTTKFFTENLLAIEMRITQIFMNKPVYLGLSILDLSKTVMYDFWYDHVKPKYGENAKPCYMDTDSFIVHVKTDDIYKDIAKDVETRFNTSNFEIDRPLPNGKNKKVIGLMKDELGGQIMKEFVGLRAKTYSYLKDTMMKIKKSKNTKKCHKKKT